jgi:DNA-binding NtrC family response regulator
MMKKNDILVFSDDPAVISPLKESYNIDAVSSRSAVLKRTEANPGILAVIDCDMRDAKGMSLFKEIKRTSPYSSVIMLSSTVTIPEAVEASRMGVADFIKKPALSERLISSVKANLKRSDDSGVRLFIGHEKWLVGGGSKIRALVKNLEYAIKERRNILFISKPGIDTLSLAKVMRDHSGIKRKLTSLDMLVFRKESLESIFWMVLQEAIASSDIIYFDKFNTVDEKHQASILDYIKGKAHKGDLMVMAGVHDKEENPIFTDWEKIVVPRLRDRREDMPDMLKAYIGEYSVKYGKQIESIALDALGMLCDYSWPGNYRELECVLENAVLACEGSVINLKDIQLGIKMVYDSIGSSRIEDLLDFKNSVEESLVNIYFKKTGSEDMTANLLDLPKSRIAENLKK